MLISINSIMEQMEHLEEKKDELTSSEYLEECNRLKLLFDYHKKINENIREIIDYNNRTIEIIINNYINTSLLIEY